MKRLRIELCDDSLRSKKCVSSKVLALIDSSQCGCVKDVKSIIAEKYISSAMRKHIDLYINGYLLCDFECDPFSFIREDSDVIEVRRVGAPAAQLNYYDADKGSPERVVLSHRKCGDIFVEARDESIQLTPSKSREKRKKKTKKYEHLEQGPDLTAGQSRGCGSTQTEGLRAFAPREATRAPKSPSCSMVSQDGTEGRVADPLVVWSQLKGQLVNSAPHSDSNGPDVGAVKRKRCRKRRRGASAGNGGGDVLAGSGGTGSISGAPSLQQGPRAQMLSVVGVDAYAVTVDDMQSPFESRLLCSGKAVDGDERDVLGRFCRDATLVAACPSLTLFPIQLEVGAMIRELFCAVLA
jgi:hypothetical protein